MDKLMKQAEDNLAKGRVQIGTDEAVLGINHIAADQSGADELSDGDLILICEHYGVPGIATFDNPESLIAAIRDIIARSALSSNAAQLAGQEPVGFARKWYIDGERPYKVKNKNKRMEWVSKFKFLNITANKIFSDDVALYTHPSSAAKVEEIRNAALNEAIAAVEYAGGDNEDYHADAIRALKTAAPSKGEE